MVSLSTCVTDHPDRATEAYSTWFHVGDLTTPRSKQKPHYSYEGGELSISPVPQVWRSITELTGMTYRLTNPNAEFYVINPNTSVTLCEQAFCSSHGYISLERGYCVSRYDPEYDTTERFYFYTEDNAIDTATLYDLHPVEDAVTETRVPSLAAAGREYWDTAFTKPACDASPLEVKGLLPVWTAAHLPVDGVYWAFEVNPATYTAPRGLIFQDQLENWRVSQIGRRA